MKPKTDPETGVTRALLFKQDRTVLAAAADKLLQFAMYEPLQFDNPAGNPCGLRQDALDAAETIQTILECRGPKAKSDETEKAKRAVK